MRQELNQSKELFDAIDLQMSLRVASMEFVPYEEIKHMQDPQFLTINNIAEDHLLTKDHVVLAWDVQFPTSLKDIVMENIRRMCGNDNKRIDKLADEIEELCEACRINANKLLAWVRVNGMEPVHNEFIVKSLQKSSVYEYILERCDELLDDKSQPNNSSMTSSSHFRYNQS